MLKPNAKGLPCKDYMRTQKLTLMHVVHSFPLTHSRNRSAEKTDATSPAVLSRDAHRHSVRDT